MSIENLNRAAEMLGLVHQSKKKTKALRRLVVGDAYSSKTLWNTWDVAENQSGSNSAESCVDGSSKVPSLSDQLFESEVVENSDSGSDGEEVPGSVCSDSCSEKDVPESHDSGERKVYEQKCISAATLKCEELANLQEELAQQILCAENSAKKSAAQLVKQGENMGHLEWLAAKVKLHAKFSSVKSTEKISADRVPIPASDPVCQEQDIFNPPPQVEERPEPCAASTKVTPFLYPSSKVEGWVTSGAHPDLNESTQENGLLNESGSDVIIQKRNSRSDSERQVDLRSKICIDKLDQNCRRLLLEKKVLQEEIKKVKNTADELGKQVNDQSQELSRLREILGEKYNIELSRI